MDEWVDVWTKEGMYAGQRVLKSFAHKNGLWHPTVHVWCYSPEGKVLIQQRGAHKDSYPLKWDVSVAGHVSSGETPVEGAIRECKEEIGIDINLHQLKFQRVEKTEKKHSANFIDREFTHTYLYRLEESTPLTPQRDEVESLEWIPIIQFKNEIKSDSKRLIPGAKERHSWVIARILSALQDFC